MLRKTRGILIAIIVLAVLARIAAALIMGNNLDALPGIDDQYSYHMLAQRIITGHGFTVESDWWPLTRAGEPTAHWSYLYTLYLGAVYAIFGIQPLAARLIQALIVGIFWPLLTFKLGRRIAGDTTGLIAAAWSAIYGYFAYYGAALMTEPFYITSLLWSLDLTLDLAEGKRSLRRWALLGLALAIAVLLRQLILIFVPFALIYALELLDFGKIKVNLSALKSRWAGPLVTLAILALMIVPWTVRNYQAFGRFVLLNTNAGFAFFWANHPIYGTHFMGILPADQSYQDLIPVELRDLSEAALDSALLQRGMQFVIQDPGRYLLLSLSRTETYFMFWPSSESSTLSNIVRVLSFGVALPFMIYGLLLSIRHWRKWLLFYLFVAIYSAIHLLSWALIRYRLPVDAVLLVFASYGVVDLVRRLVTRRHSSAAQAASQVQAQS